MIRRSEARQGKAAAASAASASDQVRKRDAKAADKLTEQQVKAVKELSVTDYLALNEKAIHNRNTVLQCRKKNFLKVLQLGYQLVQRFDDAEKM